MKKVICVLGLVGLLTGCSSTPPPSQPNLGRPRYMRLKPEHVERRGTFEWKIPGGKAKVSTLDPKKTIYESKSIDKTGQQMKKRFVDVGNDLKLSEKDHVFIENVIVGAESKKKLHKKILEAFLKKGMNVKHKTYKEGQPKFNSFLDSSNKALEKIQRSLKVHQAAGSVKSRGVYEWFIEKGIVRIDNSNPKQTTYLSRRHEDNNKLIIISITDVYNDKLISSVDKVSIETMGIGQKAQFILDKYKLRLIEKKGLKKRVTNYDHRSIDFMLYKRGAVAYIKNLEKTLKKKYKQQKLVQYSLDKWISAEGQYVVDSRDKKKITYAFESFDRQSQREQIIITKSRRSKKIESTDNITIKTTKPGYTKQIVLKNDVLEVDNVIKSNPKKEILKPGNPEYTAQKNKLEKQLQDQHSEFLERKAKGNLKATYKKTFSDYLQDITEKLTR